MKILGQNEKGQIIIDGEKEVILLETSIPWNSPAVLKNFVFDGSKGDFAAMEFGKVDNEVQ